MKQSQLFKKLQTYFGKKKKNYTRTQNDIVFGGLLQQ